MAQSDSLLIDNSTPIDDEENDVITNMNGGRASSIISTDNNNNNNNNTNFEKEVSVTASSKWKPRMPRDSMAVTKKKLVAPGIYIPILYICICTAVIKIIIIIIINICYVSVGLLNRNSNVTVNTVADEPLVDPQIYIYIYKYINIYIMLSSLHFLSIHYFYLLCTLLFYLNLLQTYIHTCIHI